MNKIIFPLDVVYKVLSINLNIPLKEIEKVGCDVIYELQQKRYRMITYLWYLNDVDKGGETEFWGTYKVKPEAGKLILFPATWSYPHCGNIPISNAKYIITGWLCADADDM